MVGRRGKLLRASVLGMMLGPALALAQPAGAPAPVPRPPASPPQRDTDALKADVQGTEDFQRRLRAELDASRGDRAKLSEYLVETATRIRSVEQQLTEVEARIGQLDRSAGDLKASLDKRRGELAQVLAALLRMSRDPPPAMLMRPDDALDAVRSAILLGALLPEMRVEAETLAADIAEQSRVRAELATARDTLTRLRAALDDDRRRIAVLVTERQRRQAEAGGVQPADRAQAETVARATGDVHDLVTRVETEVGPAARAAEAAKAAPGPSDPARPGPTVLANAGRAAPAIAFAQAKGLLPLPVAGVRLRDFGASDGVGGQEKGITLATRAGAQVSTPCDGWVVYAGPFRSYGQLLIINAGGGYHILMAGMEKITVELGQFVLTGEPVAVMGGMSRTGAAGTASTQPHLYVEFRKDGVSIDPAPWWAATDSQKVRG